MFYHRLIQVDMVFWGDENGIIFLFRVGYVHVDISGNYAVYMEIE